MKWAYRDWVEKPRWGGSASILLLSRPEIAIDSILIKIIQRKCAYILSVSGQANSRSKQVWANCFEMHFTSLFRLQTNFIMNEISENETNSHCSNGFQCNAAMHLACENCPIQKCEPNAGNVHNVKIMCGWVLHRRPETELNNHYWQQNTNTWHLLVTIFFFVA